VKRTEIDAFFRQYGPMVYRRALQILGNAADAEEATQEVFMRALQGVDAFEGRSQVSTWLYRITTNYCLNQIRNRSRRDELFDEHVKPDADRVTQPTTPGAMELVRRLLSEAPEPAWCDAAVYVFVDGMSHAEAAEVLGVSRRTVGNLLDRFVAWAQERIAAGKKPP